MAKYKVSKNNNGGGLLGFVKGTQSLGMAFWLVGVVPALLAFVILEITRKHLDGNEFFLTLFLLTIPVRMFAWISIFRCSRNTSKPVFSVLAKIIVVFDILHKTIFWSIFGISYYEQRERENKAVAEVERCKLLLAEQTNIDITEIEGSTVKSYRANRPPAYTLRITTNEQRYICYVDDNGDYRLFVE